MRTSSSGVLRRLRRVFRIPEIDPTSGIGRMRIDGDLPGAVREADRLRDAGSPARAAAAYRRALALAPDRGDLRVQLGNMLKDAGRLAEAEAVYRDALAVADTADTHVQLGHLLKTMGRRDDAVGEYRRAVALDPTCAPAVRELVEAGDAVQARRAAEAELRAGSHEALLAVGDALGRMRAELDRLARLLPDARARTAFPVAMWDTFRELFPVPPPPEARSSTAAVLLPADREDLPTLFAQMAAMRAQSSPHWTLLIFGRSADHRRAAELTAGVEPRIRWIETPPGLAPAEAERAAAAEASADWLLLLAPGALLDPQAVAWFAAAFVWSRAEAFVCDEERVERDGASTRRSTPLLRQRPDYDSLLQADVSGETVAIRAAAYQAAAPALPGGEITSARSTLLLGLAARRNVGHLPHPLVGRAASAASSADAHEAGVAHHLAAAGLAARVVRDCDGAPMWRPVRPDAPIAVLIPTRDNAGDLRDMISSLRTTAARPDALELITIDNGTSKDADLALLRGLELEGGTRLLRRDGPFNWSRLNNDAAAETEAPLLVFANDDMSMVTPGWDDRLRGLLERPEVGAVGARLLYPDDTVQHAGVLLGWKGSVIHDGLYAHADDPGPASRWHLTREVAAVTGAFLAMRRETFEAAGRFDAAALPVAYSDIDLCLRLRASGLKVLWTPGITLYHHESKSRGLDHGDGWREARNGQERRVMEERWGDALTVDPWVNPHWIDATLPFRLIHTPRVSMQVDQLSDCNSFSRGNNCKEVSYLFVNDGFVSTWQ